MRCLLPVASLLQSILQWYTDNIVSLSPRVLSQQLWYNGLGLHDPDFRNCALHDSRETCVMHPQPKTRQTNDFWHLAFRPRSILSCSVCLHRKKIIPRWKCSPEMLLCFPQRRWKIPFARTNVPPFPCHYDSPHSYHRYHFYILENHPLRMAVETL